MKKLFFMILSLALFSCNGIAQSKKSEKEEKTYEVTKTDAEWEAQLDDMAYYVLRRAGTERAFSGIYNKHYEKGTYVCGGCNTPLYESKYKFDSGTGWPSFDRAVEGNIEYDVDYKIGYARSELKCNTCGGHLGHVFNDGPTTTGKRHCINSAALEFISSENGK